MSRWQRVLLHAANLLVSGTGLAYAWMVYLLDPPDEWAVVRHPLQPAVQHLHVLVAPALVFALGLIWMGHVVRRWREAEARGRSRASGMALAVLVAPVALSGYALQVAVTEGWRAAWALVHLATGLAWVALTLAHLPWPARRGGRAAAPPGSRPAGRGGRGGRSAPPPAGGRGRGTPS